jgi:hypothetical protein
MPGSGAALPASGADAPPIGADGWPPPPAAAAPDPPVAAEPPRPAAPVAPRPPTVPGFEPSPAADPAPVPAPATLGSPAAGDPAPALTIGLETPPSSELHAGNKTTSSTRNGTKPRACVFAAAIIDMKLAAADYLFEARRRARDPRCLRAAGTCSVWTVSSAAAGTTATARKTREPPRGRRGTESSARRGVIHRPARPADHAEQDTSAHERWLLPMRYHRVEWRPRP